MFIIISLSKISYPAPFYEIKAKNDKKNGLRFCTMITVAANTISYSSHIWPMFPFNVALRTAENVFSILYPFKKIRKPLVFWCFQGYHSVQPLLRRNLGILNSKGGLKIFFKWDVVLLRGIFFRLLVVTCVVHFHFGMQYFKRFSSAVHSYLLFTLIF